MWLTNPLSSMEAFKKVIQTDSLSELSASAAYFLGYQYDYKYADLDSASKYYNWINVQHPNSEQSSNAKYRSRVIENMILSSKKDTITTATIIEPDLEKERSKPSWRSGSRLPHMLRSVELHLPHRCVFPRGLSDHGGRYSERKFPHASIVGVKSYTMHCGLGKDPPRESEPSETHAVCSPDVPSN